MVYVVQLVCQELKETGVNMETEETLEILDQTDQREAKAKLGVMAWMAFRGFREPEALVDNLDLPVKLAGKDPQGKKGRRDQQVSLERQERLDLLEFRDQKGTKDPKVSREQGGLPAK